MNQAQSEYRKAILGKIDHALDMQDEIARLTGLSAQLRLYNNGQVVLQFDCHGRAKPKLNVVHVICKTFRIRFEKTTSTQGFLKYVGFKDNVQIVIHTRECFYGGDPIIDSHPRTIAKCPIPKEKRP